MKNRVSILIACLIVSAFISQPSWAKLKVVATITDYADLASQIGGEHVEVKAIIEGSQDAHFIRPKPSFVELLRNADVLIATGLDLEMWLPSAVDKSGNKRIRSGELGYISVATDLKMKEKPVSLSKIEGGLHIYGNPHITVSPLNIIHVVENIKIGFSRNLPEKSEEFEKNSKRVVSQIAEKLYGAELIRILGQETLIELHKTDQLFSFLESKKLRGKSLIDFADGWLKKLYPFKGSRIITYHKNWRYLFDDFALVEGGFIEPKPGIPPSPRHLSQLREEIKKNRIKLIIAANYFDEKTVKSLAEDTGAAYLMLPYYVGGSPEAKTWLDLMNFWVESIARELSQAQEKKNG